MGFFITILSVTTFTSGIMLFLLMQIANLEFYATTWIYALLRIGLIFLTFPIFGLVSIYFAYLARPILVPLTSEQPDIISIYEGSYWILRGSPTQKFYMRLVLVIWLVGVFIKIAVIAVRIIRFYRNILRESISVTDPAILQTVHTIKEDLGIKKEVPIYCHKSVEVPMLVIINKPVILIGSIDFLQQELYYIIKHELVHLKRRHIFFKRLGVIIQTLYWFNPLFHHFFLLFSDYCELDCDREVLENEKNQQRLFYANLLLQLISKDVPHNPVIESAFLGRKQKKILERRFQNIMRKQEHKTKIGIVALSICYILCCPVITYGSTKAGAEIATDYIIKTKEEGNKKTENSVKYIPTGEQVRSIEASLAIDARGANNISRNISAGKSITITLTAATSNIRINLGSDSNSDSFSITFDGYRVDSSNGVISCSFDTVPDKTYKLYIDNNMDHSIHITGTIYK